ncbi:MAG: pirin family protein [Actinobacteria bacterium]|jgi:redox-sensitive bicupin YhaK (pirin superfamily)|nr:pirin family protein [Actinomycetota bacterium]
MTTSTTTQSTTTNKPARPLTRIVPAASTIEGGGFEVYRPFPGSVIDWLDPFLLLDEMAPNHQKPGEAIGAPPHPHRGFETVTYVLQGEVEHRDSAGNHGVIGPGDVQWMTAGDGIIHSEMPSTRLQTDGGVLHGLQLWVNLPASLRRTTPKYQGLPADQIASVDGDGWKAEVVAGSMFGVRGPAATHTPVGYARVTVQPGSTLRIQTPDRQTALVYAFDGVGVVGDESQRLEAHHLAVFDRTGGDIALAVPADEPTALDCIVLTGEPINEPMARYGPFVMNTTGELEEAINDFNAGRMGSIPATGTT